MTKLRNNGSILNLSSLSRYRRHALGTAGIATLCLVAQMAQAQDVAQNTPDNSQVEEITVTGTRVQRDGYNAPTPVTVMGSDQIQASAPANLQDFVNQLPSVVGSSQTNSGSASISGGGNGISALNLRSLGTSRTLVLLNGHRSAPVQASGEVDINTFPQQLVSRIDVVTGGASSDYGSDAVGGVVNFVLDTKYTGFKGDVEYGETTYGEQPNYKGQLSWGSNFDGGKGHILVSGEAFTTQRIPGVPRKWNSSDYFTSQTASGGTGGDPYLFVSKNTAPSQATPGGLIVSGPLKGTYFGVNAAVNQLAYGTVNGQWMVGGDTAVTCDQNCGGTDLAAGQLRQSIYGRVSYDVMDNMEAYAEASFTKAIAKQTYLESWVNLGGVTIQADNAFLPTSVKTALTAAKVTSFTMGTYNEGYGPSSSEDSRGVQRYLAGIDGTFSFMGDWKYDLYGQHSASNIYVKTIGNWQTQRMALAQDAVTVTAANVGTSGLAVGSIACRSTLTAPTNGCKPISRIGINGGLQSAADFATGLGYIEYTVPYKAEYIRETDFGFNITGNPFDDWAGPVSVAFGGEWRLEGINGDTPAIYGANWLVGNYLINHGHYSVAEGYVETVVPVMQGMDVNGSFRYTAYSTSGGVNTWKLGANYQPIDDFKLRVTYSHDIRAPNLSELFAAGVARSNSVQINNTAYSFVQNQTGNPNVVPEAANSLGAGIVFTPTFIEGLAMSADYYNIHIKHQIGVVSAQDVANLCYLLGQTQYCPNLHSTGSLAAGTFALTTIDLKPINYTSVNSEGIDFDATYSVPLDEINLFGKIPGDLRLHGLATHYMSKYTNDGLNPPTDAAGTSGLPGWVYRVEATYKTDPWTFNVNARGVSASKISNEYIVCQPGSCPISTPAARTINYNKVDGAVYFEATAQYAFEAYGFDSTAFFTIKNIFNTAPSLIPTGGTGSSSSTAAFPQTNAGIFDVYGRIFRVGLRFSM